jgi:hypothetical protein
VAHWSIFTDNYEVTVSSIRQQFAMLAAVRDLQAQRRLVEDVEQEIFDGKQQIEEVEAETAQFPYHLRSKAAATIEGYKQELESSYSLLLLYQQANRQGQLVSQHQLRQREQQGSNRSQEAMAL